MTLSPKENLLMALHHQIPQYIPSYRRDAVGYIPSCIHERAPGDGTPPQALGGTGKDWFGVDWIFDSTIGGSMVSHLAPPILEEITEWRSVVQFPDLDSIDWESARKADERFIDENKVMVVTLMNGPFERLHSLMGMVEANCALVTNPKESAELLMAIAEHKVRLIDKVIAYYPVDMIEVHDDWGHQKSTFMSPEVWDELIAPAMKLIVDHVRSRGKLIQVHSCGKIEALVPRMIDLGIDHWSSCQTCNDIDRIVSLYGDKLALLGGMDTPELIDPSKSREELKELVSQRIDKMCTGCGLLVYGSRSYPILLELIHEVIDEKPDFYKDPKNRELPKLS